MVSKKTTSIDPVCGMEVDLANARTSEYQGRTYGFCSESCERKFARDPVAVLQKQSQKNKSPAATSAEDSTCCEQKNLSRIRSKKIERLTMVLFIRVQCTQKSNN